MKGIEYATLDYDGGPVIIEDGEIWEAEPPHCSDDWDDDFYHESEKYIWNSETCEWDEPPLCRRERPYHGLNHYECNTDWRSW